MIIGEREGLGVYPIFKMIDLDGPIFLSQRLICLRVLLLQATTATKHTVNSDEGLNISLRGKFSKMSEKNPASYSEYDLTS